MFIGIIHFTFNVFLFLPIPITSISSILYLPQIIRNKLFVKFIFITIIIFIAYSSVHIYNGVDINYYLKSTLFIIFIIYSSYATLFYLKANLKKVSILFDYLPIIVFLIFVLGLLFYSTDLNSLFWKEHVFVQNGSISVRYLGLTYEPSYFALSVSPIFIYSLLKFVFERTIKNIFLIVLVSIPIIATLSLGFFIAAFLSLSVTLVVALYKLNLTKLFLFFPVIFLLLISVVHFTPDSVISNRIYTILEGNDTSVNGRTTDAFYLAYNCAKQKNLLMGIGPGQIKVVGEDIIRPYYQQFDEVGYSVENWPILSIPNSSAETLAIFGLVGFIFRIVILIYLFLRFKVYKNYFSLTLFMFMFIYQFMGSYITSFIEYVLWILAILPIFKEFNVKSNQQIKLYPS